MLDLQHRVRAPHRPLVPASASAANKYSPLGNPIVVRAAPHTSPVPSSSTHGPAVFLLGLNQTLPMLDVSAYCSPAHYQSAASASFRRGNGTPCLTFAIM